MRSNPSHCVHTHSATLIERHTHTHKQCLHLDYTPSPWDPFHIPSPDSLHSYSAEEGVWPTFPLSLSFSFFLSFSLGLSLSCQFLLLSLSEKSVRLRSRWGGDKQLVKQQWSVLSAWVVWFRVNVCNKDGCNNCKQEKHTGSVPKPCKLSQYLLPALASVFDQFKML